MREIEGVQPGTLDADTCAGTPKSVSPEGPITWPAASYRYQLFPPGRGTTESGYSIHVWLMCGPRMMDCVSIERYQSTEYVRRLGEWLALPPQALADRWNALRAQATTGDATIGWDDIVDYRAFEAARADAREHSSHPQVSPPIREALSPTLNPIQEKT